MQAAVRQAKEAAGDKNVLVHGVTVASECLKAGLLDEIQLHVVPVIFGQGRRLLEHLDAEQIELETVGIRRDATHLRYRVISRP